MLEKRAGTQDRGMIGVNRQLRGSATEDKRGPAPCLCDKEDAEYGVCLVLGARRLGEFGTSSDVQDSGIQLLEHDGIEPIPAEECRDFARFG
ncbi:hypothetical protein CMUS01_11317 [Colletotrichum musicola]|uniref:Uncharacterized protein n=1 Tax=Colletotrichum musicola TaxID=2175873 RepID=A0A8H6JZX0_9PEZI|nr:hypothetical protein CMUS01_11317 [Colletotrichum musicola]